MNEAPYSIGVLFVCMGNICRSPTGEGVFRHYVQQAGWADRIRVDSAGTISYHAGNPADPRMRSAAARRGYVLDSISRPVNGADIEAFDLIVAMDHDNFSDLQQLAGNTRDHIRMLGSFLPGNTGRAAAVPDPYYGGERGFEEVIDMIEAACPAMLDHCRALYQATRGNGRPMP